MSTGKDAGRPVASIQSYLDDVQARLADPAVLARATALASERGLDLETMTFGDLDDLVNDATRAGDSGETS
jgi:hypothetical protein